MLIQQDMALHEFNQMLFFQAKVFNDYLRLILYAVISKEKTDLIHIFV